MSRKEDLRRTLEALESEVDRLETEAPETHDRLAALIADLDRQLDPPPDRDEEAPLIERIPRLVEHFEVEHPRLTAALNRIMVALSDMGI